MNVNLLRKCECVCVSERKRERKEKREKDLQWNWANWAYRNLPFYYVFYYSLHLASVDNYVKNAPTHTLKSARFFSLVEKIK